jgi:two-component system cell cycle response regulator
VAEPKHPQRITQPDEPENLRITCEIDPEPAAPRPRLHVLHMIDQGSAGQFFVLAEGKDVRAGRQHEFEAQLAHPGVSREHALFTLKSGVAYVRDLNSRNGTSVNGVRILETTRLYQGDLVSLGSVQLRYSLDHEDAIQRLRALREAALRDHLTSTYNRRHFEERLVSEVAFSLRHGTPLALLLFDLDYFKRVNDQYGHQAGDAVLRAFAEHLMRNVRTEDVVARWGGEEFAVLARGTAREGALALAERMRKGVQELSIRHGGRELRVTTSVGVSHTQGRELALSASQLVRNADEALYEAKRRGRNNAAHHAEVNTRSTQTQPLTPVRDSEPG